jgi:hypothetical protein
MNYLLDYWMLIVVAAAMLALTIYVCAGWL